MSLVVNVYFLIYFFIYLESVMGFKFGFKVGYKFGFELNLSMKVSLKCFFKNRVAKVLLSNLYTVQHELMAKTLGPSNLCCLP